MNITVTGATGGLGSAILYSCSSLYPGWKCSGLSRADADLTNPARTEASVASQQPDVIIHCAAMTAVDKCETEPELARKINVEGTRAVASAAKKSRARLVYISTDFIFDGIAGAPYPVTANPAPLNVYGMTKWEGEKLALATRDALIVRTSWLYGKTGKSFPATVLKLAETRDEIRMVDDQKGSPTYSADLAEAILKLVDNKAAGIFHVSNSGHCTWFEFARAALELKGITRVKLTPTTSAEFNAPAKRPADSRLDCSRYAGAVGAPMRPWRDALAEYLKVR